jgi:hypothetical protein
MEQHKRYLRFNNAEARRLASRLLRNKPDSDTTSPPDFDFDGWHNGYYWAMKLLGENGRVRAPGTWSGLPGEMGSTYTPGALLPGHFAIIAWQGPPAAAPQRLRDFILSDAQIATVFPNGPPEVMG